MQKQDYIYMIADNVMVYHINLPPELEGDKLHAHLDKFDEDTLKIIASFGKKLLEHFFIISKNKNSDDLVETLEKMKKLAHISGPKGNLSYLNEDQIEFILTKIDGLKLDEVTDQKIAMIGDKLLEQKYGGSNVQYNQNQALENQISSASFYLQRMGYTQQEIKEKMDSVREDPSKLDAIFNLPPKEVMNLPAQAQEGSTSGENQENSTEDGGIPSQASQSRIDQIIDTIKQDIDDERKQKVEELVNKIKDYLRDPFKDRYEEVFKQMHPSRLKRIYRILKDEKKRSDRIPILLEWFFISHLLENIEVKVEHWQVSTSADHGQTGVYTAGINFARFDNVIRDEDDYSDRKLRKVIKIGRKILEKPTKKALQKMGQDLVATTGFDEHLYFTD